MGRQGSGIDSVLGGGCRAQHEWQDADPAEGPLLHGVLSEYAKTDGV